MKFLPLVSTTTLKKLSSMCCDIVQKDHDTDHEEKPDDRCEQEFNVGFEVLTAVSMKIAVFWVVATSTRLHGATTQKTAIFRSLMIGWT
jgi:hypothetical protein